jgi:uncharacterized DUF497 family protein
LTDVYANDIREIVVKLGSLHGFEGFDWDEGNIGKNWPTHGVTDWECEELFFNRPLIVRLDISHSGAETRYYALGTTDRGRLLFASFTTRMSLIRPISVRDMNARERRAYESTKEDSDVRG